MDNITTFRTNITIFRTQYTPNSTMGSLYLNAAFQCFTLEPSSVSGELVAEGTYLARMEYSPRFEIMTPHLKGVPGYDDNGPHGPIEIHYGNYPGNTEGCCLVGQIQLLDFVGSSRLAFEALVAKLTSDFTVTYTHAVSGAQ